jgi:hypothetical protein
LAWCRVLKGLCRCTRRIIHRRELRVRAGRRTLARARRRTLPYERCTNEFYLSFPSLPKLVPFLVYYNSLSLLTSTSSSTSTSTAAPAPQQLFHQSKWRNYWTSHRSSSSKYSTNSRTGRHYRNSFVRAQYVVSFQNHHHCTLTVRTLIFDRYVRGLSRSTHWHYDSVGSIRSFPFFSHTPIYSGCAFNGYIPRGARA